MSGGVTERSRLLAQLTDTLESVKSEMEERGERGINKDDDDEPNQTDDDTPLMLVHIPVKQGQMFPVS